MKNRILAAVGIVAVTAAALTACSSGGGDSNTEGPTKISFWNSFTDADRPVVEALVKQYNDSQDKVEVELNIMPGDVLNQKLLPAFQSGTGPSLVALDPPSVPSFASKKVIQPLDDLYDGQLDAATLPKAQIDATTWEGKRYGAPMSSASAMLYYNKTLLAQLGVDAPAKTLEGLAEQAVGLTKYVEGQDTTNQYGFVIPDHAAAQIWAALLWSWGGGIVASDGASSEFDSAETVKAAEFWTGLIRDKHISPIGLSGVDAGALFQAGRAAFIIEGPWASAGYTKAGIDYGVATVPAGPATQTSIAVGASMVLNAKASEAERSGAFDFMTFWNSTESQTEWSVKTSYPPNRTDVDPSALTENPTATAFAEKQDARFFPGGPVLDFAKISDDIWVPTLQKMTNGDGAPADILSDASSQIDGVVK